MDFLSRSCQFFHPLLHEDWPSHRKEINRDEWYPGMMILGLVSIMLTSLTSTTPIGNRKILFPHSNPNPNSDPNFNPNSDSGPHSNSDSNHDSNLNPTVPLFVTLTLLSAWVTHTWGRHQKVGDWCPWTTGDCVLSDRGSLIPKTPFSYRKKKSLSFFFNF